MAIASVILSMILMAVVALSNADRAGRAEAALRRIAEAQRLAEWAQGSADLSTYARLTGDRDDAIEAAAALVEAAQ